jgi:UDP-N-acetylglucosamine acyltransferase
MGVIHPSVKIGPGVIIGDQVTIEEGCEIGPYAIIDGETHIGAYNKISAHVVIGTEPQDLKYKGEGGKLTIGRGNTFREFFTAHIGHLTTEGTVIGNDNYFLTDAHVGHDCSIGNQNFIANQVLLAGHVKMGDNNNFSGNAGVHQFCNIGDYTMVSGLSGIRGDVPSYALVQGDPAKIIGINKVGLSRNGWSKEDIYSLKDAFRCFRNNLKPKKKNPFYDELIKFRQNSDRGIIKFNKIKG